MVKAVIFDFDGVISDSEPCHFAASNKALEQFGIQLTKEQYYTDYLGFTDYELFESVGEKFNTDFNKTQIEKLVEQKAIFFEQVIRQADHLIEGIPQLIQMLKNSGIKVGIYSGALQGDIELMLEDSGFENCFDVIVSADDVEKGKPDPEGYLKALGKINEISNAQILPKECVVIEDSHWGIVAAKKAGMRVIAVTNSYPADELNDADLIIDSVSELKINDLHRLCEK